MTEESKINKELILENERQKNNRNSRKLIRLRIQRAQNKILQEQPECQDKIMKRMEG